LSYRMLGVVKYVVSEGPTRTATAQFAAGSVFLAQKSSLRPLHGRRGRLASGSASRQAARGACFITDKSDFASESGLLFGPLESCLALGLVPGRRHASSLIARAIYDAS